LPVLKGQIVLEPEDAAERKEQSFEEFARLRKVIEERRTPRQSIGGGQTGGGNGV